MANDWVAKLKNAVAESDGWSVMGGMTVRKLTEHETPKGIPSRWWSSPTYSRAEFLTFHPKASGGVPSVVHRVHNTPWVSAQDRKISFKRALEILAEQ